MANPPPNPKLTHDFEQLSSMWVDFAKMVVAYFHALVNGGCTRAEALTLTTAWQIETMRSMLKRPEKPE